MMRRALQAAVLAGALVLTSGCALVDRAGAAAVVDGQRYTDTQLAADFAALDKALGNQQKPTTMDILNRNFITMWVSDVLITKAAASKGVSVTATALNKLRHGLEVQMGGADQLTAYAASKGIAPDQISTVLRDSILMTDLGAKLIGGTNTDAQSAAASTFVREFLQGVDVQIAPKYGEWSTDQLSVVDLASDLSRAGALN